MWGGYNPDLPTDYLEQGFKFSFSYYADTFIYGGTLGVLLVLLRHHLPANGARCLRKDSRHTIAPNDISSSILNPERLIFSAVSLTTILFHLVKRPSLVRSVIFGKFVLIFLEA